MPMNLATMILMMPNHLDMKIQMPMTLATILIAIIILSKHRSNRKRKSKSKARKAKNLQSVAHTVSVEQILRPKKYILNHCQTPRLSLSNYRLQKRIKAKSPSKL